MERVFIGISCSGLCGALAVILVQPDLLVLALALLLLGVTSGVCAVTARATVRKKVTAGPFSPVNESANDILGDDG